MIRTHVCSMLILLPAVALGLGCAHRTLKIEGDPETAGKRAAALVYQNPAGETLNYRFLKPLNYNPRKAYPLIFFMHGAGERGDDNTKTLKHALPQFASDAVMNEYPCFVIAPQVPEGAMWSKVGNWKTGADTAKLEPAAALRLSLELIEKTRKEYNIDARRIYVTGISMGGYGTWDVIWRHPELFAAAVPICGGGDTAKAPLFAKMPLWVFHGDADSAVPVRFSRDMVAALKQAGGQPRYTEYPGVGHDAWTRTYSDPELYRWLFAQRRR